MALNFEVCQLRGTSYSATGSAKNGKKSCQITFTQKYLVKALGINSPDEVCDLQVAYANGIPVVNYNTWYDSVSGLGYPLAVCSSKKVTRLDKNGFVFHVDVTYKTAEDGDGPDEEEGPEEPPTNVTDITPKISRSVVGRDIVLYEAPAVDGDSNFLGVRTTRVMPSAGDVLQETFDAPVTRTKPMLNITVTQFEDNFSNQTMMDRCYKVNDATWSGFQTGSCMITAINAVKQSVQMDSGPEDKFRVTYTISYDDYTVTDSEGNDLFVGHNAALPLITRTYLDGGEVKFFHKEQTGIGNVGLVDIDGAELANQSGAPDYMRFDTVDEITFSFLPTTIE